MKRKIITIGLVGMFLLMSFTTISTVAEELEPSPFITCFALGTQITLADGSKENIENLKFGDKILSYDVKTNSPSQWIVRAVETPNRPVYSINDGLLLITEDHPLWILKPDGEVGWGQIIPMPSHVRLRGETIYEVEVGDCLFTENGEWIEITDITFNETVIECANLFSFSGKQTYYANGILVYEEIPYIFPYLIMFYMYKIFSKLPVLKHFKDIFLF